MKSRNLNSQLQRLRDLIEKTQTASDEEIELQGHWGRYLCVLAAGFLENALGEVYAEFARRSANAQVANYVSRIVLKVQNPKSHRFVEMATAFSQDWGRSLEDFLSQEGRKEAIDAIINNRNQIAHGRDVGISVVRVKEYLDRCVPVVEFIESQCGIQHGY